jgi:aspartate/methionine/tyrosine aminotransferase
MKERLSKKAIKFKRTISPVREIMNFADHGFIKKLGLDPVDLISFAGGWVNHEAPADLMEAYAEIASDKRLFHQSGAYSPTLGSSEGKEAICAFEEHIYGLRDLKPTGVAVGHSSTQMTSALLHVLLDPGDSLLLLDPSYCNYPMQLVTTLEAHIIRFPVLDVDTWTYRADERIDDLKQAILKQQPKMILLVAPDNPTSQVLSTEFVRETISTAEKVGAFVVIDFAYKSIVFDEKYPEYFSWAPSDNFLSIHSNSKWAKNLGRRMGWVEAPNFVVEALESVMNSTILCPDNLHQMAFARFVEKSIRTNTLRPYIKDTIRRYHEAAQFTVTAIKDHLGFPPLVPEGGIYTVVPVGRDGASFVDQVLRSTGVLFVPGWGFGSTTRNAVRISYGPLVNDIEIIARGMRRVGDFLGQNSKLQKAELP